MVKVITIRDETYNRLLKVKKRMGVSFSDTIEQLLEVFMRGEHSKSLINLANSINERGIRKDRLRRIIKW